MTMTPEVRALWKRIEDFRIDSPDSVLTFSKRLARENDWTHDFAVRAIEEYKRFVFLAVASGHPVTPSVEVDQVWHLHLTYTESYWDDLCTKTLNRPLHHHPTKGGDEEGEKFDRWYSKTMESYRTCFGEDPPREFWPDASIRFSRRSLIRQVSDRTHWIIRKPDLRPTVRSWVLLLLGLGVGGCASVTTGFIALDRVIWAAVGILAVMLVLKFVTTGGGGRGSGGGGGYFGCGGGGGCSFSGCGGGGCGGGGCGGCSGCGS